MSCERAARAIGGVQILTFLSVKPNSNFLPPYIPANGGSPLLVMYKIEIAAGKGCKLCSALCQVRGLGMLGSPSTAHLLNFH